MLANSPQNLPVKLLCPFHYGACPVFDLTLVVFGTKLVCVIIDLSELHLRVLFLQMSFSCVINMLQLCLKEKQPFKKHVQIDSVFRHWGVVSYTFWHHWMGYHCLGKQLYLRLSTAQKADSSQQIPEWHWFFPQIQKGKKWNALLQDYMWCKELVNLSAQDRYFPLPTNVWKHSCCCCLLAPWC